MTLTTPIRRRGLTLIELLVVTTLITLLAGIVALVAPKFGEQSRVADGASQLQGWLQIARQKAIRDKAPRGLRFVGTRVAVDQEFVNKFVYVEQPDDLGVPAAEINLLQRGPFQGIAAMGLKAERDKYPSGSPAFNYWKAYVDSIDPTLGPVSANGWKFLLWLNDRNLAVPAGILNAGDIVEFAAVRYRLLVEPLSDAKGSGTILVLHKAREEVRTPPSIVSPLSVTGTPLPSARITRTTRPIAGEPELTLQREVAIDILYKANTLSPTRTVPAPMLPISAGTPGVFQEVVFNAAGEVVGGLGNFGRLILWVRDTSLGEPLTTGGMPNPGGLPKGDNRLVVIHCRTGQVTGHPVNPGSDPTNLLDPYLFVRDGKSSSLEK